MTHLNSITRMNRRGRTLLTLTAAAITMASVQAHAGGFAIREQSSEGLGAAFAGIAAGTNDLSSMFWNPATLSLHDGTSAQGDIAAILPHADIDVESSTRFTGAYVDNGRQDSGNLGSLAIVPSTYLAHQVNEKLRVGLALNSPFGLVNEANRGWSGEFHGLKSSLFSININPMASYDLTDYLSVGVGVQVQYVDVALTQEALTGNLINTATGRAKATGDDWGYGVTAGIVFKPTEYTQVGLGYRSQVKHTLRGNAEISSSGKGAPNTSRNLGKISADATMPEMVSLGVRHMVNEDWTVMGTVEWTNWSRFKELRIESDSGFANSVTEEAWNDGWFLSAGAEHKWNEQLTLRGGVAYEFSPVPDRTRTPRIPDNDRLWLSLGGSYQMSSNLSFSVGYSHIFIKDAPINLSRNDIGSANRGDLVAESKAHVDILAVSVKYEF